VELARLRSETEEQRAQILAYSRQMEDIATHLDHISQLDRKLRVITNLDPAEPLPLPGIGGIEGSPIEPHQLAGATRQSRHRRMTEMLGQLNDAAGAESKSLDALISHLEHQTARLSSTPSIAPARGWITSTFGYRTSPFTGSREFHKGLDIAGRTRTPIVASADGDVVFAGDRKNLGNSVEIRHGYGLDTIYGHLEEVTVKVGDKVKRGQKVGLMGNTGRSTGPHLHYQVELNGTPVDPRNYVLD
jgi:murein DD-endopeptidase MepM/ murein hydrolase activator NlpD